MPRSAQTVIREGACYTIAAANGRVLEVADFNTENGAQVRLWSYEGQPWQQWTFEEAADGEYRIRNRFTGKVLDLAMGGVANGTWVHQWQKTTGSSQRWQVVPVSGGKVKLKNVLANKVLDLAGMRMDNGAQAQIWQDVLGENQQWRLDPVPDKLLQKDMPAPQPRAAAPKRTRTQTGSRGAAKKTGGKGARRGGK
ncbi:MAG TPA: RICIN domain-containing protein [Candidatus Gemmiger faecigallinarum]|nr:RICIN domain-containing protein [Candidatus Gemmiger faecigallinarum]